MDTLLRPLKRMLATILPAPALRMLLSAYHFFLAWLSAILYGFPSRRLLVIAVTGTKGKSSTTEMVNAILEEARYKTAVLNSIRIKIGGTSSPNTMGRSMPGRFYIQRFLYRALKDGCTAAILEMTSEGARQHRHRFIDLDALVFTNLAPEHIESHGSYEAYANAKFEIGRSLVTSHKRPRILVANADDKESGRYLMLSVEYPLPFSLSAAVPYEARERGGFFTLDDTKIIVQLPGEFSLKNALAAATLTRVLGVPAPLIARALEKVTVIPGRAETIDEGQDFMVVVDYAHTPDSLQALLDAYGTRKKVCILGSAGGGRDTWKRPVIGRIAETSCAHVILTNDDPYDEDPKQIVEDIVHGMGRRPEIIFDRREAIQRAFQRAQPGDVVLITGKGIDPIAGPGGRKIPWNDAEVAREELRKLLKARGV